VSGIDFCPACGYALGFAPWAGNVASFEICPSCGLQFGYDDAAGGDPVARIGRYRAWREAWVGSGMRWCSNNSPPTAWDPVEQLRRIQEITIYVRLLDEGVNCWRPAPAEQHGDCFVLLGPMPEDERWEFQPGARVLCRTQTFEDDPHERLVAYRPAD
jgi:hypothetical protein